MNFRCPPPFNGGLEQLESTEMSLAAAPRKKLSLRGLGLGLGSSQLYVNVCEPKLMYGLINLLQ